MPRPDAKAVNKLFLSDEELRKGTYLHTKLSPADLTWFKQQTANIQNNLRYDLTLRADSDHAFRLYWLATGHSLDDVVNLENMPPAELKSHYEEFFKYINDPEKTPEENLKTIGSMISLALDKINAMELPLPENIDRVTGYVAFQKKLKVLTDLHIHITDTKGITGPYAEPWRRNAFFEGTGGEAAFSDKVNHLSGITDGYGKLYNALKNPDYGVDAKAFVLDLIKSRFGNQAEKTIGKTSGVAFEFNHLQDFLAHHFDKNTDKPSADIKQYREYLEGKRNDYPGQQQLKKAWREFAKQRRNEANEESKHKTCILSGTPMRDMVTFKIEPEAGDLLKALTPQQQTELENAWYKTFGGLFRGETRNAITGLGMDPFDCISVSRPNGQVQPLRIVVGTRYDEYPKHMQERALRLETMRLAMSEAGVSVQYPLVHLNQPGTVAPDRITTSPFYKVKPIPDILRIYLSQPGQELSPKAASEFLTAPKSDSVLFNKGNMANTELNSLKMNMKPVLDEQGLDIFDCIFIGNKTLNELYEEKYHDLMPDPAQKERLMLGILTAASFVPETPIFLNYPTKNANGELTDNPVPMSFAGECLKYRDVASLRYSNADAVRNHARQVLQDRKNKLDDREIERIEVLQRATQSVEAGDVNNDEYLFNSKATIAKIKAQAERVAPAYRVLMNRTLDAMEKLNIASIPEINDYRIYKRAAKLAVNKELKAEFEAKANEIKNSSLLSDYDKYLTGLEYAYGLHGEDDVPVEINSFFEEKTGHVIPNRWIRNQLDSKRPVIADQIAEESAEQVYDNMFETDGFRAEDTMFVQFFDAAQNKYFPEGNPVPDNEALNNPEIPEAERIIRRETLRSLRTSPIGYVFSRLAAESQQLEREGRKGYTLEQIMSMNDLEDRKKYYAEEYKKIFRDYDTLTYKKNLVEGTKALIDMHEKRFPKEQIFESDELIDQAFLGVGGRVIAVLFDNKQEIEYAPDFLKQSNIFETQEAADRFIKDIEEISSVGNIVNKNAIFKRMVASGTRDFANDLEAPFIYGIMKDRIRERIATGQDPYKDMDILHAMYGKQGPLGFDRGNRVIPQITGLNNAVKLSAEDTRKKLMNGTFFDTVVVEDLDRLNTLSYETDQDVSAELNECIRVVTPAQKARIREERFDRIEKAAFDYRLNLTKDARIEVFGDAMTEDPKDISGFVPEFKEHQEIVANSFKTIFDPVFTRKAVRQYLAANPQKDIYDLFYVGTTPLKDYIGQEKSEEMLATEEGRLVFQAYILKFATDPRVPLSYSAVRFDPETNTYKEAKQEDILDIADRNRIVKERLELTSVESYKNWFKSVYKTVDSKRFTDDEWRELYESEFHTTAMNGLMPEERVMTAAELEAKGNPDVYQSKIFQRIESVFGAQPVFVSDYAGSVFGDIEGKVYTRDQFRNSLPDKDPGSFSNSEFAILAYFAAVNPKICADPTTYGKIPPELADHELRVNSGSEHWTGDFSQTLPRANIGMEYLGNNIGPAREEIRKAIALYDNGNTQPLADLVAYGIKDVMGKVRTNYDFSDPERVTAHYGYMLQAMQYVMEIRPELKTSVERQLSEKEKEQLKVITGMYSMLEDKQTALKLLDDADNGREELSIENRRECIRRIASFDHYAKLWDANIKRYEGSEEYINCLIENNKPVQDELKKPGAQRSLERVNALQHLVSMKSEDLKRRKLDFDPELTAQITDAERQYEYGDMVLEEMDRAKEFFTKHHGDFLRASSEILRQNQSVNETKKYIFTPEETLNLRREKAKADFYLNQLEDKLAARLNEKQVKSIFERFNRMAEEKGFAVRANWHTDEDAAKNFKNIRLAADNEHTPLYFEAIMAEAVNFGDVLEGLADEMDAVRLPSELSLEEMSDYPEQQRIADLKTGVNADQNLNADEKQKKNDMLDKVNKYLAVRKESVYKYLSDAEERTGITGMEYINASQDNDIYHDERYNNMTVMKGVAPNAIAVIPPEKEQALNDLLADPPAISKDVADNVAKIVQKMEEYGMITGNQNMEQSKKYYGYIKLAEARKNLKTAVEKGDMAEIETATAAYEVEHRHVEEIQEMIRRSFPDDLFAPGNVDTIRNEEIPPEFSTDMVTDMKFNGIFQVAEYSKRCGVSVQDFLANPGKSIMDHYKRSAVEKGLDSKTKDHKNFMESFNYLINAEEADMSLAYMNEVVGGRVPISMDRALQPVILLETDPGRRAEQFRYLDRIKPLGEAYAANEEIALRFVNNVYTMYGSNIGKENFDRLVNGLKSAFLEGSPIQKRHLGLPVVDENGIGREDAFNYDNVLNQKDRYNVITENYHKALADAQKCDIPAAKLLMQSALFDYLMAHPEDMDNPVYKDFEKLAINAGKDLGLPQEDSAKLVSNYNTWRDSISSERRMMAQIAAESDREVDLRIRDLQKPLSEKLGAARNRVSYRPGREPQEVQDLKDEIKEIADARIQELIDAYRAKQITESYLKERYAQLDALRKDTTIDISKRNLPDIVAPHGSEQYEKDMALINDRVRNKAWTGNLRSLDAYIEYRLSQDPNLEKGDLSNEQWRDAWQNAIRVEAVKQRGQVEDDLPAGIVEPYAEIARESLKNNIINNGQDGPQVEEIPEPMEQKKGDRKFYDEISKGLAGEDVQERPVELGLPVYRSASESYLINNMRVRVDSWENGEAGKNLYGYVANLVAIQLIEGRDGRVPGRMTFQSFSKKMRDDASFRAVVKPLFDEVYNEYRDYKQRYDAASPQEKENMNFNPKSAEQLMDLIKDKAVLHAFGLETRAAKKAQEGAALQQGQDGPGVKHIKNMLAAKKQEEIRKAAEEAKKNQKKDQPQNRGPAV